MKMGVATSGLLAVLFVMAINPTTYAAQYVVGGSSGWTNFGVNYHTWASSLTFLVGDTLLFNYDSSTHSLVQVPQAGYNGCSSTNAIQTYNDGSSTVSLTKTGPLYFICSTAGHCAGGMKLQINVVAANNTTPPPATSPATPSPPPSAPPAAGTPPSTPPTAGAPPASPPSAITPPPATPPAASSPPATPPTSDTPPTAPPTAVTPPSADAPTPGSNDAAAVLSNLIVGLLLVLGTSVALLC